MKITKSLKRPVVVILLVAVIGIIVFSVVRYLMGDKEQFVEGICTNNNSANVQTAYIYDASGSNCIVAQLSSTNNIRNRIIELPSLCTIENQSASDANNLTVGCKNNSSGNSGKVTRNFDLTKCQKNNDGKYIVSNNAGRFTCPTVGPTTRPPTTRPPTTRGPTTRPPR